MMLERNRAVAHGPITKLRASHGDPAKAGIAKAEAEAKAESRTRIIDHFDSLAGLTDRSCK